MTNAAYRLASLLESYAVPAQATPESVREFGGPADVDAWRRHNGATELVRTVDYTLQGMNAAGENVDMFLAALPRWYTGVHFATTPWGSAVGGVRAACDDGDLNLLRALGLVIDQGRSLNLGEEERRTLVDVLDEARRLLENDSDHIPADIKRYLWGLLLRAQMLVHNLDDYGAEAVRAVILELGGAMTAQAAQAHQPERSGSSQKWVATALHMITTVMVNAAAGAAGNIASSPIVHQITGGS